MWFAIFLYLFIGFLSYFIIYNIAGYKSYLWYDLYLDRKNLEYVCLDLKYAGYLFYSKESNKYYCLQRTKNSFEFLSVINYQVVDNKIESTNKKIIKPPILNIFRGSFEVTRNYIYNNFKNETSVFDFNENEEKEKKNNFIRKTDRVRKIDIILED